MGRMWASCGDDTARLTSTYRIWEGQSHIHGERETDKPFLPTEPLRHDESIHHTGEELLSACEDVAYACSVCTYTKKNRRQKPRHESNTAKTYAMYRTNRLLPTPQFGGAVASPLARRRHRRRESSRRYALCESSFSNHLPHSTDIYCCILQCAVVRKSPFP